MSVPRLESGPSPAQTPSQAEIDAAQRQRTIATMYRVLNRLVGVIGRDWEHCGKAACLRSRRCRGFACEPGTGRDDA